MKTKTRGDILADRIEDIITSKTDTSPWSVRMKSALAEYRVKPEPVMVELGPEDVPPGSAIRLIGQKPWNMIESVGKDGILAGEVHYTFKRMKDYPEIHRAGTLDADGKPLWVKCEKVSNETEAK